MQHYGLRLTALLLAPFLLVECSSPVANGLPTAAIRSAVKPQISGLVYNFTGKKDGAFPLGGMITDKAGDLFGTTTGGGLEGSGCSSQLGCGVVFELKGKGYKPITLYEFKGGSAGYNPRAGVVMDSSGNLYGTTSGTTGPSCDPSCGSVFKLVRSGTKYKEQTLYTFQGGSDGASPYGSLLLDNSGALYGTTTWGGNYNCSGGCGTVFKLTPSGSTYTKTIIYQFVNQADGVAPEANLIADKSGALYGTTQTGGSGNSDGTVFKLTPYSSFYIKTTLYSFQGGADGIGPNGGLYIGPQGVIWGTTSYGGGSSCGGNGCGTVFALIPSGSTYTETIVYAFQGGNDGWDPRSSITVDPKSHNLYGTAVYGGGGSGCLEGCGVIFELTEQVSGLGYVENVRYSLGDIGGENPYDGVLLQKNYLYGTVNYGGDPSCGCGAVFRLFK